MRCRVESGNDGLLLKIISHNGYEDKVLERNTGKIIDIVMPVDAEAHRDELTPITAT